MSITFKYKPVYDYVFGLLRFASVCENRIYGSEFVLSHSLPIGALVDEFIDSASPFLISETAYFSKLGIAGWMMNALVCDDNSIETAINVRDAYYSLSDEELYNYIGGLALTKISLDSLLGWAEVKDSIPMMMDYINNLDVLSVVEKRSLLELYKYPEETRTRLTYVFKWFHAIYKKYKSEISKISKKVLKSFELSCSTDESLFIKTYLGNKSHSSVVISVSYIQDYGVKFMESLLNKQDSLWVSIGVNGLRYERSIEKEEVAEAFLKVLGDPTRFRIMTMLATENNYVQRIASELELAPSTIYHHLETLNNLSLVSTEKVGKKVYYKVHREKVLEGIRTLSSILIGGQYEL